MALNMNFPGWYMTQSRMQQLPGNLFKTYAYLMNYAVQEGTDGYLPGNILQSLPRGTGTAEELSALTNAGLLEVSKAPGYQYLLKDYQTTQASAAEIQARLEKRQADDRERQRRRRETLKAQQEQADNFIPKQRTNYQQEPPGYDPSYGWDTAQPGSMAS